MATVQARVRQERAAAPRAQGQRLALLIASGGDERIWPDPVTRRNRYGAPAAPAPDELWFSSSTASAVSPRGWAAAGEALGRLAECGQFTISAWFDQIRGRLMALYGAPGAEAVLAASGTETELVALSLALAMAGGPLVNIVVAPAETGSGVPDAAQGLHFLGRASLGDAVTQGRAARRLGGGERRPGDHRDSRPRRRAALRRRRRPGSRAARRARGRPAAPSRCCTCSTPRRPAAPASAARRRARSSPAIRAGCWWWSTPASCAARAEQVRRDLADGFAVMLTGSKFAGGPAFCGALLLPRRPGRRARRRPALRRAARPLFGRARLAAARCAARSAPASRNPPTSASACAGARRWPRSRPTKRSPPTGARAVLAEFDRAVRDRVAADPRPGAARSVRAARPRPASSRSSTRTAAIRGGLSGAGARRRRPAALPSRPAGGRGRRARRSGLRQHADDHRRGRARLRRRSRPISTKRSTLGPRSAARSSAPRRRLARSRRLGRRSASTAHAALDQALEPAAARRRRPGLAPDAR